MYGLCGLSPGHKALPHDPVKEVKARLVERRPVDHSVALKVEGVPAVVKRMLCC